MLQILDTQISTAEENMRLDARLLDNLDPAGSPILHLYGWSKPSATFGYFIRPEKHLNLKNVELHGLELAQRPTGGGIVFHIWDLAFSFLLPSKSPHFSLNTLANYRFVNEAVLDVMRTFFSLKEAVHLIQEDGPIIGPDCHNFCMAKPTQYDVVYKGMKIAGAAQRKRRQGYLHQGTISLAFPEMDILNDVLLSKEDVMRAMSSYTFAPLGKDSTSDEINEVRRELQNLLAHKLIEVLRF